METDSPTDAPCSQNNFPSGRGNLGFPMRSLNLVISSFPICLRLLMYPLILILVMLFRPQGLMGMRELSFVGLYKKFQQKYYNVKKVKKEGCNE